MGRISTVMLEKNTVYTVYDIGTEQCSSVKLLYVYILYILEYEYKGMLKSPGLVYSMRDNIICWNLLTAKLEVIFNFVIELGYQTHFLKI